MCIVNTNSWLSFGVSFFHKGKMFWHLTTVENKKPEMYISGYSRASNGSTHMQQLQPG
jgi:hypothetical protein